MDEDENGLQLGLGLGCGRSSGTFKSKSGSSSLDIRPDDADKDNKFEKDIKSFFLVNSTQKEDLSLGSHRTDSGKTGENFFNPLSTPDTDVNAPTHLNHGVLWDSSSNRSAGNDGERRSDAYNKRKMFFEDMTNAKKHDQDTKPNEFLERKASYISITTEEGSTAHNEDVAESEVEVSAQASHSGDSSKQSIGFRGPSNISKEFHQYPDTSPSGAESKHMNSNYSVPFSVQPANNLNVPFSISTKESDHVGALGTSGHSSINMMQVMPPSNGERQNGVHSINAGSSPVTFGYLHVQLPTLDKNTSWLMGSHPPQINRLYAGSNLPDSPYHAEDDSRGPSTNLWPKDSSELSTLDGFSVDFSAIKPGIAADVNFGGCGSCPNLPWVSTTAPGPNGKTISGVTYKYSANQIKIVCACHGSHMSPDEFVRHASEENTNIGVSTYPNSNPAASAQS